MRKFVLSVFAMLFMAGLVVAAEGFLTKVNVDKKEVTIDDSPCDALHERSVWNLVEILGEIRVYDVSVPILEQLMHSLYGTDSTSPRPIAISFRSQISLEDRLEEQFVGRLHLAIADRGDAERSLPASGFRDHDPSHRLRLVGPRLQLFP